MIEVKNVTKSFDDICAVRDASLKIEDGAIFGLIGTNGAGKSTLLRILSGVLRQDSGTVTIDGEPVYDNVKIKEQFFYLSDEQYFFNESTPVTMAEYYSILYRKYDKERFLNLLDTFQLDAKRRIRTLSKGMKKQVSFLLGICANTKYLFCDETFDGLDPVMRQGMKSLFAKEVAERKLTPVITSHNLRELEDICDCIGLLHKGGVLLSKDIADLKLDIHKIQFVLEEGVEVNQVLDGLDVIACEQKGKLITATLRGSEENLEQKMQEGKAVYFEILPLSLEEIFISETEAVGYDIKKLV